MSFDQDPNEQADISGADLALLVDENRDLRRLLFFGHSHNGDSSCLYGDDGEMTCNVCFCDFKHDTPQELERKMTAHAIKEMEHETEVTE